MLLILYKYYSISSHLSNFFFFYYFLPSPLFTPRRPFTSDTMSRLNVSQFIDSLNSLEDTFEESYDLQNSSAPLPHTIPTAPTHQDEDLSIFANTHFFDFDMGCATDIAVNVDDLLMQQEKQLQAANDRQEVNSVMNNNNTSNPSPSNSSVSPTDFSNLGLYFNPLENLQQFSLANELLPTVNNFVEESNVSPTNNVTPLPASTISNPPTTTLKRKAKSEASPPAPVMSTAAITAAAASKKRKMSSVAATPIDGEADLDDDSRVASEEDKRRRNTAASARFRIKKKMREQQMVRTAKELQEKVESLETKIVQLEMENQWLKDLVVAKNDARDTSDILSLRNRVLGKSD